MASWRELLSEEESCGRSPGSPRICHSAAVSLTQGTLVSMHMQKNLGSVQASG